MFQVQGEVEIGGIVRLEEKVPAVILFCRGGLAVVKVCVRSWMHICMHVCAICVCAWMCAGVWEGEWEKQR